MEFEFQCKQTSQMKDSNDSGLKTYSKIFTILSQLGFEREKSLLDKKDIHIHFPAGAVGKDGPSAGVTIATVLVSLFSRKCVRSDVAMTGEITLRGLVLPVSVLNCCQAVSVKVQQFMQISTSFWHYCF